MVIACVWVRIFRLIFRFTLWTECILATISMAMGIRNMQTKSVRLWNVSQRNEKWKILEANNAKENKKISNLHRNTRIFFLKVLLRVSINYSGILNRKIFGNLSSSSSLSKRSKTCYTIYLWCMADSFNFCYAIRNLHRYQLRWISTKWVLEQNCIFSFFVVF